MTPDRKKIYAASHTSELKNESFALAPPTLSGVTTTAESDEKHVTNCAVCDLDQWRECRHQHLVLNTHNIANAKAFISWP